MENVAETTGFHTDDIPHPEARQAVARSISHNEIVHLGPYADTTDEDEVLQALSVACEVRSQGTGGKGPRERLEDFAGIDEDCDEWRVIVEC